MRQTSERLREIGVPEEQIRACCDGRDGKTPIGTDTYHRMVSDSAA